MSFDIPDVLDMWEAHDIEQSRRLERLPKCFHCGDPVQQEFAVRLDGHGWLCDQCIKNNMEEVPEDEY